MSLNNNNNNNNNLFPRDIVCLRNMSINTLHKGDDDDDDDNNNNNNKVTIITYFLYPYSQFRQDLYP